MAAFDLPSWLEPKEAPWHALVAGAQVGSQIAANRARNQALYAEVQQSQQRQDLQEREFIAKNEAHTLTNEVIRLKMTNDTHDFEQLRAWWPKFSEATGDGLKTLELPALRNPDQMQKIVGMVTQKRQAEGVANFAETVGRVDLTTPEGQEEYWASVERNPAIAGKMGLQNLMQPIKIAEDTKRLRESAAARTATAADRTRLAEINTEIRQHLADSKIGVDDARVQQLNAEAEAIGRRTDTAQGNLDARRDEIELRRQGLAERNKRIESKLPEADRIKLNHELNVLREQLDTYELTPAEYYKKRDETYQKYTPKETAPAAPDTSNPLGLNLKLKTP